MAEGNGAWGRGRGGKEVERRVTALSGLKDFGLGDGCVARETEDTLERLRSLKKSWVNHLNKNPNPVLSMQNRDHQV